VGGKACSISSCCSASSRMGGLELVRKSVRMLKCSTETQLLVRAIRIEDGQ
jgi:hypothetical protein